jgi:iron(III) transport system substrate-binding protein
MTKRKTFLFVIFILRKGELQMEERVQRVMMVNVMRRSLYSLAAVISFLTAPMNVHAQTTQEMVVFSGRKEPLIKPVIELFEQETGIRVTLKTGESAALGQQLLQEKAKPSADVYIAKESGSLEYLRQQGVFEKYESKEIQKIPARFRASDGSWVGVSGRSRAVIYNTTLVKPENVPHTLQELLDPRWNGKIAAVNMGNESFVDWVSALRLTWGDQQTEEFLRKLKGQVQLISKSHTDVRKAVGRGEYPLGLINHYYFHLQKQETDPIYTNVGIVYLDQKPGERGELVNVAGIAIVKGAPHLLQAQKFIDFLVSPAAQKLFAELNFEYPLLPEVETHRDVLESMGCQKTSAIDCLNVMDIHLDQLGPEMNKTTELLENIAWQ